VAEAVVRMKINGEDHEGRVEPRKTLADFLREDCHLTGTHLGCEHGVCGACTVLVDGRAVRSCLMFAVQAEGSDVTTIEGIAGPDGELNTVQEAFRTAHGLQCGFCTPGFVVAITELLAEGSELTESAVREELSGNICRCTGYQGIVRAVVDVLALAGEEACVLTARDPLADEPHARGRHQWSPPPLVGRPAAMRHAFMIPW